MRGIDQYVERAVEGVVYEDPVSMVEPLLQAWSTLEDMAIKVDGAGSPLLMKVVAEATRKALTTMAKQTVLTMIGNDIEYDISILERMGSLIDKY